jgi:2-octaprenyl-6-methoxyphenol hydroxylase
MTRVWFKFAAMQARTDVVIAGGGQIGLVLALALKRAAPGIGVTVIDAAPAEARAREGRASTIVAGGQRMLAELGVWDTVAGSAERITAMEITDSRTGDAVRPVFLTFVLAEAGDGDAYVIADGIVTVALAAAAEAAGIDIVTQARVEDFTIDGSTVTVRIDDGRTIRARLLVAADGARSRVREFAGIQRIGTSYGHSGIVATVSHERPHGGKAWEHFLPGGPFASLPLADDATGRHLSSLVWTEPTDIADRLVAGDALTFQVELERRFGHRLGAIDVIDRPQAFPLGVYVARDFVRPRLALAGDAAHTVHPIAGQGLNLGYRDAAALAEVIVEAYRLGLDIGSLTVLERYQRWRRYDTTEMALVTDGLNRLFSNDNPALRAVRDVGLGLVDRLPELKRLFIGNASGTAGSDVPRLMRGEAI